MATERILPNSRPKITADELFKLIESYQLDRNKYGLFNVGLRGYYANSLGEKGKNDLNIYDDAIVTVSENGILSFNSNTDPSYLRKGSGFGANKGMATLKGDSIYYAHQFGMHRGRKSNKGYMALVQRLGKVTVIRSGNPDYPDTGMFGINMHRGGYKTTSSEGCQTVYPDQYNEFIENGMEESKRLYGSVEWEKTCIPYILLNQVI
jgi:lysozyme